MEAFKEDLRKWTREEIESSPGRLAAQIVFNQLIRNKFCMWFIGNVEGNQLYTVTLSNKEKALVSFTEESIASNYINREGIIEQINESFGPKVVLVSMSLRKIDDIMQNNISASIALGPNVITQQLTKTPLQTVVVNPNDRDFFVPLNVPYIMQKHKKQIKKMEFNIDNSTEDKELCLYEIDTELKKYVFCPDGFINSESEIGGK
tara:strand:- start:101 stop:715 length:615 start_codon:yes stop_codon:yes gene_type:complete